MLSKVAERVYWMARSLERTENTARLISVHTSLLMDMPAEMEINWFTLVKIFNAESLYHELHLTINEPDIMHFLVADENNPSSLISSLSSVRENVRTTLDILPEDMWEQVNQAHLLIKETVPTIRNRHRRQLMLRRVISHCQAILGVLESHLCRNHTYDFVQTGKYLERADMTSRILEMTSLLLSDARSDTLRQYESILWTNVLQSLSAHQMYLQHMRPPVKGDNVLRFLVQSDVFPHAIRYAVMQIAVYVEHLPTPKQVLITQKIVLKHLMSEDVGSIPAEEVHILMDYLQSELTELHVQIAQTWFTPQVQAD
ncbi:alpha-E domain-containing protein [Leucothrix mucor]|uniref:alpha-E domain-containing protein n=1 Tax=Leucothrix mucor TaxID=45248 RepID=UPI0003B47B63|nr:alpha-E domain-containing protein [Leucothrix mucor]